MKQLIKDWGILIAVGVLTIPAVIIIIGINFLLLFWEYIKLGVKQYL